MTPVYVPITARRILRDRIGESEDTGFRWRSDVLRRISLRVGEVTSGKFDELVKKIQQAHAHSISEENVALWSAISC